MKIYRLLEIIIYLLNHEVATAKQLATRFEVSTRTIQRDMDCLLIAGIPIVSKQGSCGGYGIEDGYKLKNQFVRKDDFQFIILALKSLSTSYESVQIERILDTYIALSKESYQPIYLDYSVSKEDQKVQDFKRIIEQSIQNHVHIYFEYRTSENYISTKHIQPIALRFQWYAWYLFGYDMKKMSNRTYKLARMDELMLTKESFDPFSSEEVDRLLKKQDDMYLSTCETIEVLCKKEGFVTLKEYFPQEQITPLEDGSYKMFLHVPTRERLWQALLLSMGDDVKILSPVTYRDNLIEKAKKFLANHDI